jgi:uncharacterized protein YfbU (UPF0304 family)
MSISTIQKNVELRIKEIYPFDIYPSISFLHKKKHLSIDEIVNSFIEYQKSLSASPVRFYLSGYSIDDSIKLGKGQKRICKNCSSLYDSSSDIKGNCSSECHGISKEKSRKLLSDARKSYNPRDPVAYSKRHSISIEDAIKEVKSFCVSNRTVDYWTSNGFSEDEAVRKIRELQTISSPRSIQHWVDKGFSEVDARLKVSEIQKSFSHMRKNRTKDQFWICKEYWMTRGFSEDDAIAKIQEKKIDMANSIRSRYANLSTDDKRKNHPLCIEFYIERGMSYDDGINRISEILQSRNSGNFFSKISQDFCDSLDEFFHDDSTYYQKKNKEFGSWDHDNHRIYFYDYVNVTRKFVVEFHGDYWHVENDEKDIAKEMTMRKRGYRYFVVWESDYRKDPTSCINNLKERILDENSED